MGELLGLLCYLAPYQKQFIEQGLGTKETLVMIRAKDGQMLLNTLFFADEVVKNPAKEVTEKGNAAELKMAQTIIESMTGKFEPEQYKDEYREKVQEAIEKKIAGKEIAAPKEKISVRYLTLCMIDTNNNLKYNKMLHIENITP